MPNKPSRCGISSCFISLESWLIIGCISTSSACTSVLCDFELSPCDQTHRLYCPTSLSHVSRSWFNLLHRSSIIFVSHSPVWQPVPSHTQPVQYGTVRSHQTAIYQSVVISEYIQWYASNLISKVPLQIRTRIQNQSQSPWNIDETKIRHGIHFHEYCRLPVPCHRCFQHLDRTRYPPNAERQQT